MKPVDNQVRLAGLKAIAESVEASVKAEPPGMIKARLIRIKKQVELIIEELKY